MMPCGQHMLQMKSMSTHDAARNTAKYDKEGLVDAIRIMYPTNPEKRNVRAQIYGLYNETRSSRQL